MGSQVKDPGNNVTGLQKHFVKGKGTLAALLEKQQFYQGTERCALVIDISLLLGRCQKSRLQGAHLEGSGKSNWNMEASTSGSSGLALIWAIRDQKAVHILTLSSDL